MEFGPVQAVVAGLAVTLIVLGFSYRHAAQLTGKLVAQGEARFAGKRRNAPPALDHSRFKPPGAAHTLTGRANPQDVAALELVTWEADDADRIEAAFARIREDFTASLKSHRPESPDAVRLREALRQAAEARANLLGRLQRSAVGGRKGDQVSQSR